MVTRPSCCLDETDVKHGGTFIQPARCVNAVAMNEKIKKKEEEETNAEAPHAAGKKNKTLGRKQRCNLKELNVTGPTASRSFMLDAEGAPIGWEDSVLC